MKDLKDFNLFKKFDFQIGIIIFFFAGMLYSYYAISANIDLSEGKHVLFMDEQIVFNGVNQILNSESTTSFLKNISHRGDHRYGKILFNVNALVSSIPKSLWGESGQIITIRLLQTLFLMVAYFIISITFLKKWFARSLLFFFLLTLTCTSYYFTMPKPEPLQILFIALFLFFSNKKDFKHGWHWIFMGLALGTKISALPIIAFYLLLTFYQERTLIKERILIIKKTLKTMLAILIGWVIAEPTIVFGDWQVYRKSTWDNTAHGVDDSSVTVISWIQMIIADSSILFLSILALGLLLCLVIIIYWSLKLLNGKPVFNSVLFDDKKYLILILGFLLLLFYIVKVDRLWNFYLHIPFIFILTGVMIFAEKFFYDIEHRHKNFTTASLIVVMPLTTFLLINAVSADSIEYNRLASRTSKPKHISKSAEYNFLVKTLKDISIKNNKVLDVYYDPQIYLLSPSQYFNPNRFWGYFLKWEDQYDVVVFYPNHGENLKDNNLQETNVRYNSWKRAMALYDEFTTTNENSNGFRKVNTNQNEDSKNDKWVSFGDWTYPNGGLRKLTSNHIDVRQSGIGLKPGKNYQLDYEIKAYTSGGLFCKFGGGTPIQLNDLSIGKHSIKMANDGTIDNFQFVGAFIGEIQHISLKEESNIDSMDKNSNLLGDPSTSDASSKMRNYIKLSDDSIPETISVYLKSDIYNTYKNKK